MEITEKGLSLELLQDNIDKNIEYLNNILGDDFTIRAEGVIDNIIVSISLMQYLIISEFSYLIKQFDPMTAEGIYLDALYQRVGLFRKKEAPTKFSLKIKSFSAGVVPAGSIVISDIKEEFLFVNSFDIDFNDGLIQNAIFESVINEDLSISSSDDLVIIEMPDGFSLTIDGEPFDIVVGNSEESDYEFRKRFLNLKNITKRGTRNAVIETLSKCVNDISQLAIYDSNTDENLPAGAVEIVAKPSVTDEIFAKTIYSSIPAGIELVGNTAVDTYSSEGQCVSINFYKAIDIPVEIRIVIKRKSNTYKNTVFAAIKNKLTEFFNSTSFGLKAVVSAAIFTISIQEADGVDAVSDIKLRRSEESGYSSILNFSKYEIPYFCADMVDIVDE